MSRAYWPIPNPARTIHLIGDIQTPTAARRQIVTSDMTSGAVPDVPYRVTVGDFIDSGVSGFPDSAYAPMIEFIESLGSGQWWSCAGNHDAHDRTPAQAAALMGMPGANFTVDLGFVVLVVMWVRCAYAAGQQPGASIPTDTAWLDTTLDQYAERRVVIVGHAPLWDPRPANSISTENAQLISIINNHPQVVGYFCGHTHIDIATEGIAHHLPVGNRTIAHLNGSALVYTSPDHNWNDRLCTQFVTFEEDRIEVRYRDHGARQWVGGGPTQQRVWTHPLT